MLGLSLLDFKGEKQDTEARLHTAKNEPPCRACRESEANLDVGHVCMPLWGKSVSGLQESKLRDEQGIMHERSWGPDPMETCAMQLEPVMSGCTSHRVAISSRVQKSSELP